MIFHLKTIISEDKDERGESTLLKPPFSSQKKNYTLEAPFCGIVAIFCNPFREKVAKCFGEYCISKNEENCKTWLVQTASHTDH